MAKARPSEQTEDPEDGKRLLFVGSLALVCWIALLVTCRYSGDFDSRTAYAERPILTVMSMLAIVFAGHLVALFIGLRIRSRRRLTELIVAAAVVFRITLLPTPLVQELDIYRYLWDGAATTAGVSPFRYSPDQVRQATANDNTPDSLAKLIRVRDEHPGLAEALARVHFGELTTIYPPVSQVVFALATVTTPKRATINQRVIVMKAWLVAFDLATLWVLIVLLRLTKRHVAWSIAYGWSPLVLKEFANAGHLDSIAVFLTMLAILLITKLLWPPADEKPKETSPRDFAWVGVVLGLAVGAKIYPIILLPWLTLTTANRHGWKTAGILTGTLGLIVVALCWPLLPSFGNSEAEQIVAQQNQQVGAAISVPQPAAPQQAATAEPGHGPSIFIRYWEMNDFIFMILVENLKPTSDVPAEDIAWFSVVPESWRMRLLAPFVYEDLEENPQNVKRRAREAAFMLTRIATGIVYVALALVFAWFASKVEHPVAWLSYGFLTIAWFWLLAPTQNPWYWVWALPLVGFARSRVWLAMGGLVLLYYLRFWFEYQWPEETVPFTDYYGKTFFDFVVTWIEYLPFFIWLAVDWYRSRESTAELTSKT